jgi:hypothetical protein
MAASVEPVRGDYTPSSLIRQDMGNLVCPTASLLEEFSFALPLRFLSAGEPFLAAEGLIG